TKIISLRSTYLTYKVCDIIKHIHLGVALKAGEISPEGDQEPWSQARSSSWQAAKEVRIRMLVHSFFNLLVELGDQPVERFEHGCQSKHSQAGGQDDRWVCGQGRGLGNGAQAFFNRFVATAIVFEKEASQRVGIRSF